MNLNKSLFQYYYYLLHEWGSENNLNDIESQDNFIKNHWSSSDTLYVLTLNGSFIGCIAIDRTMFYPYFSHLYIVSQWRKQGFGEILIKFVENYVLKNGMSEIRIWCKPYLSDYYKKFQYKILTKKDNLFIMVKYL